MNSVLTKLKQILVKEVNDDYKSIMIHDLLSKLSSDYTIKYARKERHLIYRIVINSKTYEQNLNI